MKRSRIISVFLVAVIYLFFQPLFAQSSYVYTLSHDLPAEIDIELSDSLMVYFKSDQDFVYSVNHQNQWRPSENQLAKIELSSNVRSEIEFKFADNTIYHTSIHVLRSEMPSVWFYFSLFLFIISLVLFVVRVMKYQFALEKIDIEQRLHQKTDRMIQQRQEYEKMLAERLPKEEAEELKVKGKAKRYKMVTVLFSDIQGFTKLTTKENPEKLVDDLDKFFFHFDQTVKKYNIQKIKTVGDSYMCAGGIPKKNRTNPLEVVLAAFEMQQYMDKLKEKYPDSSSIWGLRVGIHTGPVFAGREGHKKQAFDIWGETVNIASRMQSSSELGKINISGATYELIRDYFLCEYHGKMPVKFRGDADMYFIEGFRPTMSVKNQGFIPNEEFYTKLAFIRFDDLEEEVLDLLEHSLPDNLSYHNLKHTIDVVTQVELIGRQEGVADHEMLVLKTAALFHDTGFTKGYEDHELLSIKIAQKILPRFNYSEEQIEKISDLIYATKLPPKPKNKLEKIICDADLDYLGRVDFIPVSETLFKELVEHNVIENNYDKWNKIQEKFIESHQYFTDTAKRLRDVNKKKQLENIRKQIKN